MGNDDMVAMAEQIAAMREIARDAYALVNGALPRIMEIGDVRQKDIVALAKAQGLLAALGKE